jgi:hypothetical protein
MAEEKKKEEVKRQQFMNKIIDEVLTMWRKYDLTNLNKNDCKIKYMIVEYSINKIDEAWKDSTLYIPTNFDAIENKGKYQQSRIDLLMGIIKDPPKLCFDSRGGFDFVNGRHRFANLRDLGCQTIPCIIEENDQEKMDNLLK